MGVSCTGFGAFEYVSRQSEAYDAEKTKRHDRREKGSSLYERIRVTCAVPATGLVNPDDVSLIMKRRGAVT